MEPCLTPANLSNFLYERRARRFVPTFFSPTISPSILGCGPAALAVLTGVDPYLIAEWCFRAAGSRSEHGTAFPIMEAFLKHMGFEVTKVTPEFVCSASDITDNLSAEHCLLVDARMTVQERSWLVLWGPYEYHNFSVRTRQVMDGINHPAEATYLLFHPDWKLGKSSQELFSVVPEQTAPEAMIETRMLRLRRRVSQLTVEIATIKACVESEAESPVKNSSSLSYSKYLTEEALQSLEKSLSVALGELCKVDIRQPPLPQNVFSLS